MKLKEYFENLKIMVDNNPSYLDFEVIFSIDDEGNEYKRVTYSPSPETFDLENMEMECYDDTISSPNIILMN